MEFNYKTGQTALTRAGHGQTSIPTSTLFTDNQTLLSPCPFIIPCLFLPIHIDTTLSLPYLSPKHPVISLAQCQNALPWHLIMSAIPQGRDPSVCVVPQRLMELGFTWLVGLMFSGTALGHQGSGSCLWGTGALPLPSASVHLCMCACLCGDLPFTV